MYVIEDLEFGLLLYITNMSSGVCASTAIQISAFDDKLRPICVVLVRVQGGMAAW